jgi:hypothetical protein
MIQVQTQPLRPETKPFQSNTGGSLYSYITVETYPDTNRKEMAKVIYFKAA